MANWIRHAFQGSSSLSDRMTWYANNIPNFSTLYDSTDNEGIIRITQETATDTFDFYPKAAMTDGYARFKFGALSSTTAATFQPNLVHNNGTDSKTLFSVASARCTTIVPSEVQCPLYLDTLLLSNNDLLIRTTYEQVRSYGLIAILHGSQIESDVAKNLLFVSCSRTNSTAYPSDFMCGKSAFISEDGAWTAAEATINNCMPYTTDMTANGSLLTNYLLEEYIFDGISSKVYKIYGPNAILLQPFVPLFINGQEYMTLGQGLVIKIEYD